MSKKTKLFILWVLLGYGVNMGIPVWLKHWSYPLAYHQYFY